MSPFRRAPTLLTSLAVVVATAACGGATLEPVEDDGGATRDGGNPPGSDAGNGGDASSPTNPACPPQVPASGSSCSSEGVYCEYGAGVHINCDTVANCSDGAWYVSPPDPGATNCSPTQDPRCPPTYVSVPTGMPCDLSGLECDYSQGLCGCTIPEGPPMVDPDGGLSGPSWQCVVPTAGCPIPRPHLGTACAPEGLYCDYGMCTFEDGDTEECMGGYWNSQPGGCALDYRP